MLIQCKYCKRFIDTETVGKKKDFEDPRENEILQNECLKIQRRIDKLQQKHDFEDLTSWQLNEVNRQLSVLRKILEVLKKEI